MTHRETNKLTITEPVTCMCDFTLFLFIHLHYLQIRNWIFTLFWECSSGLIAVNSVIWEMFMLTMYKNCVLSTCAVKMIYFFYIWPLRLPESKCKKKKKKGAQAYGTKVFYLVQLKFVINRFQWSFIWSFFPAAALAPTSSKYTTQLLVVSHMENHYKKISKARRKLREFFSWWESNELCGDLCWDIQLASVRETFFMLSPPLPPPPPHGSFRGCCPLACPSAPTSGHIQGPFCIFALEYKLLDICFLYCIHCMNYFVTYC